VYVWSVSCKRPSCQAAEGYNAKPLTEIRGRAGSDTLPPYHPHIDEQDIRTPFKGPIRRSSYLSSVNALLK